MKPRINSCSRDRIEFLERESRPEYDRKTRQPRERRVISAHGFSESFACRPFNAAVNLPRPHPDQKIRPVRVLAEYRASKTTFEKKGPKKKEGEKENEK